MPMEAGRIIVAGIVVIIGSWTAFHGLLNGVVRRKIRNRFLRDIPFATGSTAIVLGIMTVIAGCFFIAAGLFAAASP